jgi:hypothetical protein
MAEPEPLNAGVPETQTPTAAPAGGGRSKDEVALDLMKFITVATGYGKASQSSAGFSTKPMTRSAEEHAEALLELFERCRRVMNKPD